MCQLPVECAAALLLYHNEQKEAGEGDVSVLLPFPRRRLRQTDTRHGRLWCVSFTTGRGSPTCEVSETPPHIKRDEMGRRRAAEIHVSAPKCADTNRPISSARHVNVPSETEQTDKCVLTVWTQALKPPSPSNSQTLTGNVCRTTPGGMVCVCVCVNTTYHVSLFVHWITAWNRKKHKSWSAVWKQTSSLFFTEFELGTELLWYQSKCLHWTEYQTLKYWQLSSNVSTLKLTDLFFDQIVPDLTDDYFQSRLFSGLID